MDSKKSQSASVDEYFNSLSESVKKKLQELRNVIKEEVPDAQDVISYNMPALKHHGKILIYYAAFKNHIGFYPTPSPIEEFKNELSDYKTSKGAIQFPLNQSLPLPLIRKIMRFRVQETQ